MSSIQPELYPWLIGGAVVLIVLFAFLARKTLRNPWLRRETSAVQPATPEQRTSADSLPEKFTNTRQMAEAVHGALDSAARLNLVWLLSAMAGYGPTVQNDSIRNSAVDVMKPAVYGTFLRAFRAATGIPGSLMFDKRSVEEITLTPLDQIYNRDAVLAVMVMYSPSIKRFYKQNAAIPEFALVLPGFIDMTITLDQLDRIHREFYPIGR
ncbi:MAG TPA: hypothetical protein VJ843_03710 [Candidatus Saccharimonadales bacterium]|nr:hypothetical protein [Candidatus Saccharimonadales bacterium]